MRSFKKNWNLRLHKQRLLETKLEIFLSELNPHLLFNSLNSVVQVLREDSVRAETMLLLLCDYYQTVLTAFDKKSITLSEELELCNKFIEMHRGKFPQLVFSLPSLSEDLQHFLIPPLILQPLLENSLKHGVRNLAHSDEPRTVNEEKYEKIIVAIFNVSFQSNLFSR